MLVDEATIDSVIAELRETQRPSIQNTQGLKHYRKLRGKLQIYFLRLRDSFPASKVKGLADKHAKEFATREKSLEADTFLVYENWLKENNPVLYASLKDSLVEAKADGFKGTMDEWLSKYGLGVAPAEFIKKVDESILTWAEDYCAELVKGVDDETKRLIAQAVKSGLEDGKNPIEIARDIRKQFDDMAKYRAERIARTETANALESGAFDSNKSLGADKKEWIWDGRDCDACRMNEAQGKIGIDRAHASGHMHPTAHPNCKCTEAYYGVTEAGIKGGAIHL